MGKNSLKTLKKKPNGRKNPEPTKLAQQTADGKTAATRRPRSRALVLARMVIVFLCKSRWNPPFMRICLLLRCRTAHLWRRRWLRESPRLGGNKWHWRLRPQGHRWGRRRREPRYGGDRRWGGCIRPDGRCLRARISPGKRRKRRCGRIRTRRNNGRSRYRSRH